MSSRQVATKSIDVSQSAGMRNQQTLLINDDEQWAEVWRTIWSGREELGGSLPRVDFRTQSVVIAALGGRPSGGYRVTLDVERSASDVLTVMVTERQPAENCTAIALVTYPISVVIVPVAAKHAAFHSRTVTEQC